MKEILLPEICYIYIYYKGLTELASRHCMNSAKPSFNHM